MPLTIWVLAISAFAVGTTEFVIVGLIPTIAGNLHVSLPSAGLLVTFYAIGVAVGAPVLTAVTGRVPRKTLLLGLMVLFTVGNIFAWLSPGYGTLIAARFVTGLAHGLFFSIASAIAANLVSKEKAARAIALVFSGLTVALVAGVPVGIFIGQHFGWRETFLAVAFLGTVAFTGSVLFLPSHIPHKVPVSFIRQTDVIIHPRLILVYLKTALGYGGSFIAFTFVTVILEKISGFGAGSIGFLMIGYGIAVALGNIWGGKLADKKGAVPALQIIFALLALVLFIFSFSCHNKWAALITLFCWGIVAFGNVPGLQLYVVRQAERFTPGAVDVASGMNIAAFNVGIAAGAFIGGVVAEHLGLDAVTWVGGLVVLSALLLTVLSGKLDQKDALQEALTVKSSGTEESFC